VLLPQEVTSWRLPLPLHTSLAHVILHTPRLRQILSSCSLPEQQYFSKEWCPRILHHYLHSTHNTTITIIAHLFFPRTPKSAPEGSTAAWFFQKCSKLSWRSDVPEDWQPDCPSSTIRNTSIEASSLCPTKMEEITVTLK
jgi:hypothetical protein